MGAIALALAAALAGCSKADPAADPSGAGSGLTSSTAPADGGSSSAATPTGGSSGAATGTPTAAAPADQSTPEAAMTAWLNAMVGGDGQGVCSVMATRGKAFSSIPGASASCIKTITPLLDQLKELKSAFEGLTISGATVSGANATFESVTTEPAVAAEVVSSFKAVKIGGKWYITQ
ncbi:hypothetical protein N865_13490 [Intrasporangium oryzae NRRL B-24470]|uniref:Lipoprotein n=2 Tax=Intrasporangium TaxID=53357 RepID=W9G492_9MICO|nr:hypothetical protein N865_13490 [Intrasporangium oryzae NRRL B-24470]